MEKVGLKSPPSKRLLAISKEITPKNQENMALLKLREKARGQYHYKKIRWNPHKTAIIVVDMWNKHPCLPSEKRIARLAKKINDLLPFLRNKGVQVIFSPSKVVSFYADTLNRRKVILINKNKLYFKKLYWLKSFQNEPTMPVLKGCENNKRLSNFKKSFFRQHPLIKIKKNDLISAKGNEVINILMNKKINLVLYVGVHSNVCVVSRSFGMRNLKKEGFQVVLIRDLTDSYTKKATNFLSQKERNEVVISHIETYIGPTIHSNQLY